MSPAIAHLGLLHGQIVRPARDVQPEKEAPSFTGDPGQSSEEAHTARTPKLYMASRPER